MTAFEAPLRGTFRLSVLKGSAARAAVGELHALVAQDAQHWIVMGLDADLDEAMRDCVRNALTFLTSRVPINHATAYAYLTAAVDFEVSQVVDGVKGVHCRIRKDHFDPGLLDG